LLAKWVSKFGRVVSSQAEVSTFLAVPVEPVGKLIQHFYAPLRWRAEKQGRSREELAVGQAGVNFHFFSIIEAINSKQLESASCPRLFVIPCLWIESPCQYLAASQSHPRPNRRFRKASVVDRPGASGVSRSSAEAGGRLEQAAQSAAASSTGNAKQQRGSLALELAAKHRRETIGHLSRNGHRRHQRSGPAGRAGVQVPFAGLCRLGLIYYWTKECEFAIGDIARNDRKALQNVTKKFSATMDPLPPTILHRGAWKTLDDKMLPVHRRRLTNMITEAYYLRECMETMITRKVKDGGDFDWRRNVRCYARDVNEQLIPSLYIQDLEFPALKSLCGCLVQGPSGCGKTETVKGLRPAPRSAHLRYSRPGAPLTHRRLSKLVQAGRPLQTDAGASSIEVQKLPADGYGRPGGSRAIRVSFAGFGMKTCFWRTRNECQSCPPWASSSPATRSAMPASCPARSGPTTGPSSISRPDLLQVLKMNEVPGHGFRAPTPAGHSAQAHVGVRCRPAAQRAANTFGLNLAVRRGREKEDSTLTIHGAAARSSQQQQAQPTAATAALTTSEFWPPFKGAHGDHYQQGYRPEAAHLFVNKKAAANLPLSATAKQRAQHDTPGRPGEAAGARAPARQRPPILRQAVADVLSAGCHRPPSSARSRKTDGHPESESAASARPAKASRQCPGWQ
uniref:AAA_6 domain-containing protein n=1 Tax=Macrostomum lignano TaxID=282301 RepID=A0A1I8FIK3_9PLAT